LEGSQVASQLSPFVLSNNMEGRSRSVNLGFRRGTP